LPLEATERELRNPVRALHFAPVYDDDDDVQKDNLLVQSLMIP
jgi:hypothetical protein